MPSRCSWCGGDPLMIEYHDTEWGVPSTDDRHLFELLTLEGAQAGFKRYERASLKPVPCTVSIGSSPPSRSLARRRRIWLSMVRSLTTRRPV